MRKAKILAARLQNPEFESWVDRELNGYIDHSSLPPYRIISVVVQGTLSDGWRRWDNAPIMTSYLPEKFSDWGERSYFIQPIATIAAMAKDSLGPSTQLQAPWPQELAVMFGAKGYNGFECLGAWQIITRNALGGVVETVRNRLLDFALKIEAENPHAGEAPPHSEPVPQDKVQQLVNNYFGPVGNIAQHSQNFRQTANTRVEHHDLRRLVAEFTDHIDELKLDARQKQKAEAQISTLRAQLADEPDPIIVNQAGRTLQNITEGAIGSLLAAAVQPTVWQWVHQTMAQFK